MNLRMTVIDHSGCSNFPCFTDPTGLIHDTAYVRTLGIIASLKIRWHLFWMKRR